MKTNLFIIRVFSAVLMLAAIVAKMVMTTTIFLELPARLNLFPSL